MCKSACGVAQEDPMMLFNNVADDEYLLMYITLYRSFLAVGYYAGSVYSRTFLYMNIVFTIFMGPILYEL